MFTNDTEEVAPVTQVQDLKVKACNN